MIPLLPVLIIGIAVFLSSCREETNSLEYTQVREPVSFEVEGPYQLKSLGNQFLYANTSAQGFQLIDISEFNHPHLTHQALLRGYPKEFYIRGAQYLLLQHHSWSMEGNRLTLFYQEPKGHLTFLRDFDLPGELIASQRHGSWIYTVIRPFGSGEFYHIIVWRWNNRGEIEQVKNIQLFDQIENVVMFPDDLILTSDGLPTGTKKIQIFSLSQPDDPLVELPSLQIEGTISSNAHVDVFNQQLRIIYDVFQENQTGENPKKVLAVYDLSSPEIVLVGKVELGFSEAISSATRFINQYAWIVTQGGQLWNIDLSNPSLLRVTGHLEMMGQIHELVSHDNLLLLLLNREVDQQTRLELNLVDTTLVHQPVVISQFVPATTSQLTETFLKNEKALFINWSENFVWLHFNTEMSSTTQKVFLQRVSLRNRSIQEAGRFESPVSPQHLFQMTSEDLVVVGDQKFLTFYWPSLPAVTLPQELGNLELAVYLTNLQLHEKELWAKGKDSFQVYRYATSELGIPGQSWTLSQNYSEFEMDQHWAIFYDSNPLVVELLDTLTGQLYPPQVLLEKTENIRGTFVYQGGLYYAELQENRWILHQRDIPTFREISSWSVPSHPERFFVINGELITQETSPSQTLLLNRWALDSSSVHLLSSREFPCLNDSPMFLEGQSIYVDCQKGHTVKCPWEWGPGYYEEDQKRMTQILKLNPGKDFSEEGNWLFKGIYGVEAVAPDTLLLIIPDPFRFRYNITYANYEVYRVLPGQEPFLLKTGREELLLNSCGNKGTVRLTPNQIWMAQQWAGLREVHW